MPWRYPERWPGWSDHARVGGGLFDDPYHFVKIVRACWAHYCATSGLGQRLHLDDLPTVSVVFSPEVLAHSAWHPCLQRLQDSFSPEISGHRLPLRLASSEHYPEASGAETRQFFFDVESPKHQALTCHLYLGQDAVHAVGLNEVYLRRDQRMFAVQRRLGFTRNSDILQAYTSNAAGSRIPASMRQDLRYLGWTFEFALEQGEPVVQFTEIAAAGFWEGGELAIQEGTRLPLGQVTTFYQGLNEEGFPDPALACRLLIVPTLVQPQPPQLHQLTCFLHQSETQDAQLEVRAWLNGPAMPDDQVTIQLPEMHRALTLHLDASITEAPFLYKGWLSQASHLQVGQALRYQPKGENRYGLAFPSTTPETTTVRGTARPTLLGQTLLQRQQLRREWTFELKLDGPGETPDFDLAAFTLCLAPAQSDTQIKIPLASIDGNRLRFRYLPRSVDLQAPFSRWENTDKIGLWLLQDLSTTPLPPEQWRLNLRHNQEEQPLCILRVVDFDLNCRLLPAQEAIAVPSQEEIVVEGHRLQLLTQLQTAAATPTAQHLQDLLLYQPPTGPIRATLRYQGPGWLTVEADTNSTQRQARGFRALWFSCGQHAQSIADPKERNPEGGPCFSMGLGIGHTQEMAQIRATSDGFRLYRHRTHIPVHAGNTTLGVEGYQEAKGWLFSPEQPEGWLLIDKALIHYRYDTSTAPWSLQLSLVGYLFSRTQQQTSLALTYGQHSATTQQHDTIDLALAPEAEPALQLTLRPHVRATHQDTSLLLHAKNALPAPAEYGRPYHKGPLEFALWQHQQKELCFEYLKPYARKRFHLSYSQGVIGFWSQGSAFLQATQRPTPITAPSYARQLSDGTALPQHELVVGNDPALADLLLPPSLDPQHSVLFTIGQEQGRPYIRPIQALCVPLQWETSPEGRLTLRHTQALQAKTPLQLSQTGRWLFQCEHLIFEWSQHPEDCREMEHTDGLLSIRAILRPPAQRYTIGGSGQGDHFPLFDPVPGQQAEEALYTLSVPDITLHYQGEGVVGIQQQATRQTLRAVLLQQLLEDSSPHYPSAHPLAILDNIRAQATGRDIFLEETPPAAKVSSAIQLFTQGERWHCGSYLFEYRRRNVQDGHPPPDKAPGFLALCEATVSQQLTYSDDEDGFTTASGQSVSRWWFGRPAQGEQAEGTALCWQTRVQTEQEEKVAKVVLQSYAPRRAFGLVRQQGQTWLEIPAPKQAGQYHIVLEGEPCREARRHLLQAPVRLHINHLLQCRLEIHEDHVHFEIEGFLLGHPRDPSLPVVLGHGNRMGTIHLPALPTETSVSLTPAHREACLRQIITTQGSGEPVQGEPTSTVLLPHGGTLTLVDLKKFTTPLSLPKPPLCDRLLWWSPPTDPRQQFQLTPTSLNLPDASAALDVDGRFAEDEGSSFAFGAVPEPIEENVPSEDVHRAIRVGWFPEDTAPKNVGLCGFVSEVVGPRVELCFEQHQAIVKLVSASSGTAEYALPSDEPWTWPAIWRRGEWIRIQHPQRLEHQDLLLCGHAAFSVHYQRDPHYLAVCLRWLWVPAHRSLQLMGQQARTQHPTRHLTQTTIPANAWGTQHETSSHPHHEAVQQIRVLGLAPSFQCLILPPQKGHLMQRTAATTKDGLPTKQ